MKHIKMLGLAVVAAAALTAFLGVSSASAYTLCKTNVTSCPTGGHYTTSQVFHATTATATLTFVGGFSGQSALTCHSETTVEQTSTGDTSTGAVSGTITSLKFDTCSTDPSKIACEVTEGSGYTGSIVGTSGGNGTLTVASPTETLVVCASGFLNCTFTTAKNGVSLKVTGGNPATFEASEVKLGKKAGGAICPNEVKWDAKYSLIGEPTALFVTK